METPAEDGHLTSWKASWPSASGRRVCIHVGGSVFFGNPPNPSQPAHLTEQLWSMGDLKFAAGKLKQNNSSDDKG